MRAAMKAAMKLIWEQLWKQLWSWYESNYANNYSNNWKQLCETITINITINRFFIKSTILGHQNFLIEAVKHFHDFGGVDFWFFRSGAKIRKAPTLLQGTVNPCSLAAIFPSGFSHTTKHQQWNSTRILRFDTEYCCCNGKYSAWCWLRSGSPPPCDRYWVSTRSSICRVDWKWFAELTRGGTTKLYIDETSGLI